MSIIYDRQYNTTIVGLYSSYNTIIGLTYYRILHLYRYACIYTLKCIPNDLTYLICNVYSILFLF